jgi:uncharacterized protein (TIGR02996 family)
LTDCHAKNHFCSVQFSPDGKTIIAGDARGLLHRFDVAGPGFPVPPAFKVWAFPDPPPRVLPPAADLVSLLRVVKESPDDDAPRLVLAKYLEENDDPRGEFMRVQCELAELAKNKPDFGSVNRGRQRGVKDEPGASALMSRESELLALHSQEWLGPMVACAEACEFRRGLLHVSLKPKQFFARAMLAWLAEIAVTWLDGLTLYNVIARELDRLAALPFLENLTALSLTGNIGAKGMASLAASPHLSLLRELDLGGSDLGEAGAAALADSPLLSQLTSLKLGGNKIGNGGLEVLLASLTQPRLVTLEVQANGITEVGARLVAASPHLSRLRHLDLGNNNLGDAGVGALAASAHLANLSSLALWFTAIGSEGAAALARSPYLANLVALDLSANGSLASTQGATALRERFGERVRL